MESNEVVEVEIPEGKSTWKRTDWEWEEKIWWKQMENELTDIKVMVKYIHETVIGILHWMKMSLETSKQVECVVEKFLEDDEGEDEDEDAVGSAVEELVPTQEMEDAELGVVVEADGGEKVDLEKEVDGIVEDQDETMGGLVGRGFVVIFFFFFLDFE